MSKTAVTATDAPAAIGPYSQAIKTGNLLFISGQLPIDPATGKFTEGDIGDRTHQVIKNIIAIANEAGADLSMVVKTTVFLTDMNDFQAVNKVYAEYFNGTPPARSAVQVAGLPLGADVEIETIISFE